MCSFSFMYSVTISLGLAKSNNHTASHGIDITIWYYTLSFTVFLFGSIQTATIHVIKPILGSEGDDLKILATTI